MANKIIIAVLVLIAVSGCLFSAKEIVLDPDKGYGHANVMEE